jgi:hypothetical protein
VVKLLIFPPASRIGTSRKTLTTKTTEDHREKLPTCDIASFMAIPINQLTKQIIASAMKVHSILGPGLLESAYHACLLHELRKQGLIVESQVGLPVVYEGEQIDLGYRIDLIVTMQSYWKSSAWKPSTLSIRLSYSPTCD